jgi:FAD-linked oxidoreductase
VTGAVAAPPGTRVRRGRRWRNFGRNQSSVPTVWERPTSEDELVDVVHRAATAGRTVKAVGAGHSYSAIACTDGHLVDLSGYGGVRAVEAATGRVTVEAGITLRRLNEELHLRGLALPVLGDIDYQTIAGATATGTHGPGIGHRTISDAIVGMRLVTGDGTVVAGGPDATDPAAREVWDVGRVGLGALGLVSTMTLRTVPAFDLHAVEEPMAMARFLAAADELVDANDHLGLFWFPGSDTALVKRSNRTSEERRPRSRRVAWTSDLLMDNVAFGLACRAARRVPAVARSIVAGAAQRESVDWIDRSDRVFRTPRLVRVVEMEYGIPREAFGEAFARLGRLIDAVGTPITVPVEIRWTGADDIALSHASGRDTAYIAVHVYQGVPHDQYFQGVEAIMDSYGGRPHWGKLHFQSAETLAPRYPGWDRFGAVRRRTDPDGRFANPYLDRVLGPVSG